MKILEAKEDLFHDDLDQSDWDTGLVISFDEGEEIFSEWLKNDADMDVFGCAVVERIEERNDVLVTRVRRVGFLDGAEEFDLVPGRFGVPAGRLDNLEG
jgi:hypothetical protein